MRFKYAFCSERVKVKHTSFYAIHLCLPIIGALLFILYYRLYGNNTDNRKLEMILELTAMIFPLLISVIVSLNVALEEKSSHFQALLAVPNRYKIMLGKLTYLYSNGVMALFVLVLLFSFGVHLLGMEDMVQLGILMKATIGIAFSNLIIYIFHMFLSFRFGLGLSLFFGVFESLQCILYSNIKLQGVARYIPFSWSMNCIQDALNNQISLYWIGIVLFTMGSLLLYLLWFSRWEGRKNYE